MRSLRTWTGLTLSLLSLGVACSAGEGGDSGTDENSSAGSANTQTGGAGTGGGFAIPDGGGTGPVDPGTPPDTSGVVEDPPLLSCTTTTECCDAVEGCTDPDIFVCTSDHYCGLIKDTCSTTSDCQGDTYCCDAACRNDGVTQGVCIPASVPPGTGCNVALEIGEFSPNVQCAWSAPKANELEPTSKHVLSTPLVANLPYGSGDVAELVFITTSATTTPSAAAPGVIRILNGQDCSLIASIVGTTKTVSALATPAIGDLDDDGTPEIVARGEGNSLIAFAWDGSKYVESFTANGNTNTDRSQPWAGPSLHDLNSDGKSEILLAGAVFSSSGALLYSGSGIAQPWNGLIPVAADVDRDGKIELISSRGGEITASEWNGSSWVDPGWDKRLGGTGSHFAVADFGSMVGGSFDSTALDGVAEVVAVDDESGVVSVRTLGKNVVFSVNTGDRGGPPVVGDFDNDGFPEVGVAGKTRLRVFDLDCPSGCNGETMPYVRWSKPSQDASSAQTGATIFDFDGDGNAEVVYADECFLRVYSGTDGKVLFSSYRTSATWYESPLVADIDGDQNTEIVVNSNDYDTACPAQGGGGTAYVDPIHAGVTCSDDAACPLNTVCTEGLCRCAATTDCCGTADLATCGLTCAAPIDGSTGKVCRATHPGTSADLTGIRVLRDRLDRWASSRGIWNQHAYSITNVEDDGQIPMTTNWTPNFADENLNNYRQNVQGEAGFDDLPDITGRFADEEACVTGTSQLYLQATVCNRGDRAVGANLPATFYEGSPSNGKILCTSYTDGPVPTGGCKLVYCAIAKDAAGKAVTLVVNDDGKGGQTTVECHTDNNTDSVKVGSCLTPVPR